MAIVVEDAWSSATPATKSNLVSTVARTYGLADDNELRGVSLGFLDDAVKEMNAYLYNFNRMKVTGLTLTEGTREYSLPTDFFKESQAYLVDASDNKQEGPLDYLPWVHYVRYYGSERLAGQGVPVVYSLRNLHREGLVIVGPTPSAGAATNYTLSIEYYRRIPLVSEENPLNVPQEVETPLVYNAQKALAIHIHGAGHPDVDRFDMLEEKALKRLIAIDKRHPDQKLRFRLADHDSRRSSARGRVYLD